MRKRALEILRLALVLWTLGGRASFVSAAFTDLGAGARAPGMGGAVVAFSDDVYAIYYNPAGLGLMERPMLATSYSKLYLGLSDGSNLSTSFVGYAQPLKEGRWGTLGAGWNSFSLDSLYTDQSFYLSYGKLTPFHPFGGDFYAGGSVKYLSSSFGSSPEASNATDGALGLTGQADPVLSGRRSIGAFDTDLGFLYRYAKKYSLGLDVMHLNSPNVSFAANDVDRLEPAIKVGLAYGSLISNLALEADNEQAATGLRTTIYTASAERWFPFRFIGDLGLRGGLGIGSEQYTLLSAGVSYRTRRLQVDYAFQLPINTISSPAGTQRLALSFRFGRASDEEESLEMVLEAMRELKAGRVPEYHAGAKGLSLVETATVEEYLAQVRGAELKGEYREALSKLAQALGVAPGDQALATQFTRLNFVAQQIPSLPSYKTDPTHAALYEGFLDFFAGDDQGAVEKVADAARLRPGDRNLATFLEEMEKFTGIKHVAAHKTETSLSYEAAIALTRANAAVQDHDYENAVKYALEVLAEDPQNVAAWEDLGTSYLAMKDFENSRKAWRKAYAYEKSPAVRAMIKGYLRSIEKLQSRAGEQAASAKSIEPSEPKPNLPPEQERALYDEGIDHYTKGEFEAAKKAFQLILESDPNNVRARKALQRVMEEMK